MNQSCILVLGTPRSGTSCVAGILHHLGVFMGDKFIEANPMNEAGFFQDIEFEELFDDLPTWMPASITMGENHSRLRKLRELVNRRNDLGIDWGAKFKHAAFVVPVFQAICPSVKLIVMQRDSAHSIASLTRWSEPHDQDAAQVINRSAAAINKVVSLSGLPTMTVNFNTLLADAPGTVGQIAGFIDRPVTPEAVSLVNPALRRY